MILLMAWNRIPQQMGRIPLMELEVSKITSIFDPYNIKMGVLVKVYFLENVKLGFCYGGDCVPPPIILFLRHKLQSVQNHWPRGRDVVALSSRLAEYSSYYSAFFLLQSPLTKQTTHLAPHPISYIRK
jgi:hypothetical protein